MFDVSTFMLWIGFAGQCLFSILVLRAVFHAVALPRYTRLACLFPVLKPVRRPPTVRARHPES
jgi:hypothetical protein